MVDLAGMVHEQSSLVGKRKHASNINSDDQTFKTFSILL